jgi:hypothetical protein
MKQVDWTAQHCGVHQASFDQLLDLMPDVAELVFETFVDCPKNFTWDVKVHMLMPNQFPCIPNWHYDNVPRINNKQDWDAVKLNKPMYLYVSGPPFTEFRKTGQVKPCSWTKFSQKDEHRGTISEDFQWRGFIRATHVHILPANKNGLNPLRRHSQVYLDSSNFAW